MVLYSKFIAKAIPNKMHTGNNPKIMYMLFFITYYSAKTLNRYKNNIYMYMKTKRKKNRSFRKNRSFKKKELKKNPTRKNVGGHLMGVEARQWYVLPPDNYGAFRVGPIVNPIVIKFSVHSFKHLNSFNNDSNKDHNDIKYPICERPEKYKREYKFQ